MPEVTEPTIARGTSRTADVSEFKRTAVRGAIWVAAASAAAIPLTYYRNWVLGQAGDDGLVVGVLAVLLLFVNLVTTFVLFGGVTVVTNYLPKLPSSEDKSAFLASYGLISGAIVVAVVGVIAAKQSLLTWALKGEVDQSAVPFLLALLPIVVAASIANYAQAGLMDFRMSALLNAAPTFVTCLVATAGVLLFPEYLARTPFPVLASGFVAAYLVALGVGGWRVIQQLGVFRRRFFLPDGFWRYAGFVHLNTITPFLFNSIDQAFVLAAVGMRELGAYFVMMQMAEFCRFVPNRISQVMLASFSHLVGSGEHDSLKAAYKRLSRLAVVLTTLLVLGVMCLSPWLAELYGDFFGARYRYLIPLAALAAVGSVGAINSMLIMAKERTGIFLVSNLTLVAVQLVVTLFFIADYGVFAVIFGRAAGVVWGQIGNFSIIRWGLPNVHLAPPREYWPSLAVVGGVAAYLLSAEAVPLTHAVALMVGGSAVFLATIRFRYAELGALLQIAKSRSG